jgi:hypothetical protein
VHVNDVRALFAEEASQPADRVEVELVAEGQAVEADVLLRGAGREHGVRPAHDRHVVAALAQSAGGLKHLMHGAGVELIELQDLEDLHGRRGAGL